MTKRYDRELTLEEMANIRDEDIDCSDIPELSDELWSNAKVVYPDERSRDEKKT